MTTITPHLDLLSDLNEAQLEAVRAVEGPLAIIAGAGTGKTRVISRRTAFAIASGVVPSDQVLVVTFTDKAATEMMERLRALGLPGVTARTFHAHALSQLRHFWPIHNGGAPLPNVLDSKLRILVRLARGLPGHYRFTPAKDLADEIEWAKSRRVGPAGYAAAAATAGRTAPLPVDLFVRVFSDYERTKKRMGLLDFDDMLIEAVELLERDSEALELVRARKSWFSVDEYQDTNPLQERLLELWLGSRPDLCVVGDEDQTIYTFTGASSSFLTSFAERHREARVVMLRENYRSSPEVLDIANRLIATNGRTKRLSSNRPGGPRPTIGGHATAEAELAAITRRIGELLGGGTPPSEIAILVRMNAQLEPIESALTRAAIAYRVRGPGFYRRPDVRGAIDLLRHVQPTAGRPLAQEIRAVWTRELGYEADATPVGGASRERMAALDTLLAICDDMTDADPDTELEAFLGELGRRAATERGSAGDGVELLTYHRAKGLEWDAVFLPMLEEGSLPIRQAFEDEAALDEERRLLYVGITRARIHLSLSWAAQRESRGRDARRRPSRFLDAFGARPVATRSSHPREGLRRVRDLGDAFIAAGPAPASMDSPLLRALRDWRSQRARAEVVPAYVVAHDAMLAAIAELRPGSLAALRRIKGMGPVKLERYGPEILEVVAATVR